MSYAHPIRDIRVNAIWIDASGARVTAFHAAERYVASLS